MTTRRLGIALSLWSLAFACVHVAWGMGWRGGLPDDFAPISERPWFLAYDLLAGALMYGAAMVALLIARGRATPALLRATIVGSALALLRGLPALGWDVGAGEFTGVGFGADVWFTVAGLLGLALARSARRTAPPNDSGQQRQAAGSWQ